MTSPRPTAEDRENARRFVETEMADRCPVYLASNKENLIECVAWAEMQKRLDREQSRRCGFAAALPPFGLSRESTFTSQAKPAAANAGALLCGCGCTVEPDETPCDNPHCILRSIA